MARTLAEHPVRLAKVRAVTAEVTQSLRSDARDNRARILEAAGRAFATEGLDVPMREIARRAEVGPATVYRHFPTKDALFMAAFADQMTACSKIIEEGLAAADPWRGFRTAIERVMEVHARDRGFCHAFVSRFPNAPELAAERDRALRGMAKLVRRAKEAGALRPDVGLDDVVLVLMANEGIHTGSRRTRAAASRRFAALMIESFRAGPDPAPLPPAVRLPV